MEMEELKQDRDFYLWIFVGFILVFSTIVWASNMNPHLNGNGPLCSKSDDIFACLKLVIAGKDFYSDDHFATDLNVVETGCGGSTRVVKYYGENAREMEVFCDEEK